MNSKHLLFTLVGSLLLILGSVVNASATLCASTPYGTPSPNDWTDDTAAIDWCINSTAWTEIELDPGSPGYILDTGITISRTGWTLKSSAGSTRASVIAGRDLFDHMLASTSGPFTIEYVSFNGMVDYDASGNPVSAPTVGTYRTLRNSCAANGPHPGNLELFGNNITFRYNESTHSICGSGLGLQGEELDVHHNYIAYNGRDKFHGEVGGSGAPCDLSNDCAPWSDGITMLKCEDSVVHNNVLVDNTDFQLLVGGGGDCDVHDNEIYNGGKFAFAGLNVSEFNMGNHNGSVFYDNTVIGAASDRLGVGIVIGSYFWPGNSGWIPDGGTVRNNYVEGAAQNFVISGVDTGWVHSNSFSSPQGSGAGTPQCGYLENYIAYNFGPGLLFQSGATPIPYHNEFCDTPRAVPTVSISSPGNGSSFSAFSSITISASASSTSGSPLSTYRMAYRKNGANAVVSSAQGSPNFTTSSFGPGTYDITVWVNDTAGNYWTSGWITIYVS